MYLYSPELSQLPIRSEKIDRLRVLKELDNKSKLLVSVKEEVYVVAPCC